MHDAQTATHLICAVRMSPSSNDSASGITLLIIMATPSDHLRVDELFKRGPLEQWDSDTRTLLGDATHPLLPHA